MHDTIHTGLWSIEWRTVMFEMACGLAQDIWNDLEGVISVGIQGSYARGEAGEGSDVDIVEIASSILASF